MQPTHAKWEPVQPSDTPLFPPISSAISSNYLVTDTIFVSPPTIAAPVPGPDGSARALGSNGLSGISKEVLDELPDECRGAFEEALREEQGWKGTWSGETHDGMRGGLRIGYAGFPV